MIPSVARTVVYITTKEDKEAMKASGDCIVRDELPAIIVSVAEQEEKEVDKSTLVNLRVFLDGELTWWKVNVKQGDGEGEFKQ